MKDFARLVRERRAELGWTLEELHKKSGLSVPYISNIEHGRREPRGEKRDALLDALGYDIVILRDRAVGN